MGAGRQHRREVGRAGMMAERPGDMEPGGRLYRVMVLIPMQERHWEWTKSVPWIGMIVSIPLFLWAVHLERQGSEIAAYSIMGIALACALALSIGWPAWLDRKRRRLGDEHLRAGGEIRNEGSPMVAIGTDAPTDGIDMGRETCYVCRIANRK